MLATSCSLSLSLFFSSSLSLQVASLLPPCFNFSFSSSPLKCTHVKAGPRDLCSIMQMGRIRLLESIEHHWRIQPDGAHSIYNCRHREWTRSKSNIQGELDPSSSHLVLAFSLSSFQPIFHLRFASSLLSSFLSFSAFFLPFFLSLDSPTNSRIQSSRFHDRRRLTNPARAHKHKPRSS